MSKPEFLDKTPMNISEVKAELEKIRGKTTELNFRAQKTEEYAQDFARLSLKEATELFEALKALNIARLKENHINKLIDLLPVSEKHVKIILNCYNVSIPAESTAKIAETIAEYRKK